MPFDNELTSGNLMLRSVCAIVVLLALGGCDRDKSGTPAYDMAVAAAPAPARMMAGKREAIPEGPKLAYSHDLSIETKADSVKQRFEQIRDACLNGTVAGCVLLRADIAVQGFEKGRHPVATLSVRLPHDAVAPFEQIVLKLLPGEQASDVAVLSRSTSAEDLTAVIQDGDRRLAQLSDYRERLNQLAKRADAKVDDMIKVEGELSTTQSQIEELTAEQNRLNQRVATEMETVQIAGRVSVGTGSDIAEVWHRAGELLDLSIADALQFLIQAVPWVIALIVVLVLLPITRVLIRVLWRAGRKR
jgi:hypothetical protein